MNIIYLVRHAHANWTPDENRPLSSQGHQDAIKISHILQQYPVRAIYSSPYTRALQTIEPLASCLNLPVQIEAGLRERELGNTMREDFLKAVEKTWNDPGFAYPKGETNSSAQKRGMAVIRRLQNQFTSEQLVLSTHGNLMALLLQVYDPGINFAFWKSLTMPDIYSLHFMEGGKVEMNRLWQEN